MTSWRQRFNKVTAISDRTEHKRSKRPRSKLAAVRRRSLFQELESRRVLAAVPFAEDFQSFAANGFAPTPSAGQLDSDDWRIIGMSQGDTAFGDTETGSDFTDTASSGGETGGGLYPFDTGGGNIILGVQPTGSDFTPGSFDLLLTNGTGSTISDWDIAYDIYVFNNATRSSTVNFEYSTDDGASFQTVPDEDFATPEPADSPATWVQTSKSFTLTGVNVAAGDDLIVRWQSNENGGSGSRDEFGIDNISISESGAVIPPSLSITADAPAEQLEGDSGLVPFTYTVTRGGDLTVPVDVDFAVSGDVDAADFGGTLPTGMVSFAANDTTETITINVSGDTDVEPDEDFTVTLSNPTASATITTGTAAGTILTDEFVGLVPPQVNDFESGAGSSQLGDGWSTFSVDGDGTVWTRETDDQDPNTPAGNGFAQGNGFGATNPSDDWLISTPFDLDQTTGETLSFDTAVNFTDSGLTADEQISLFWSNTYSGIGDPTADFPAVNELTFTRSTSNTFTSSGPIDVSGLTGTLVWFGFRYQSSGTGGGTTAEWQVDNFSLTEANTPPDFSIAPTDADKAEGDAGTTNFTFTVTRSDNTTGTATVDFTVNNVDTDASDISGSLPATGTVEFADGESTQVITVEVTGDTDVEPDEDFTVTLSNASSGTISTDTATGTIVDDDATIVLVINEILADPDATNGDANGDGTVSTSQDEFVELVNTSGGSLDISGWTISDGASTRHTFAPGTILSDGQAVVVFGGGSLDGDFGNALAFTASSNAIGLNNGGDTVTVRDSGSTVIAEVTYGGEGGNNTALTREPDLTGSFVEHDSLPSSLLFSPGFENDGTTAFPGVLITTPVLYINEIMMEPLGDQTVNEYIELRGIGGEVLPSDVYLVLIDGDSEDGNGTIDKVFPLGGVQVGSNGFIVLVQDNSPYTIDPGATVLSPGSGTGWGSDLTFASNADQIENDSVTALLIQTTTAPSDGDDVDSQDSGELDGDADSWTILDGIGNIDGGQFDTAYAALNYSGNATQGTSLEGPVVNLGSYHPDYLARIGDSTLSTQSDWVVAEVADAAPNFTLATGGFTDPSSLEGAAIDHLGATNTFTVPGSVSPGDLVINEIMQNPDAAVGGDNAGEYVEIWNTTGSAIDINGFVLRDDGSDSHTIDNGGPLEVPANGFLVLGRSDDIAQNGGVTVDYVYSGFTLSNGADEVVLAELVGQTETVIDQVSYDGGPNFPDPNGRSMELIPGTPNPAVANDDGANWQAAFTTFGDGDAGTPGAANSVNPSAFTVTETDGSTVLSEFGIEAQRQDTFSVVLDVAPFSDVVLTISSDDIGEATVSPATLTFTPANFDTPQFVTVEGVFDDTVDGQQTATITVAVDDANSDDGFDELPDQTVTVTVNDVPSTPTNVTPTGGIGNQPGATVFTFDDVTGESGYALWIDRLDTDGPGGTVVFSTDTIPADSTQFTIPPGSELPNGDYRFWIVALTADGFSPANGPNVFSVGQAAPSVPVAPTATGTSDSGLGALRPQIDWPADASPGTQYSVYLINLETNTLVESASGLTTNSFVPTADLDNAVHRIWISATNAAGSSGQGAPFDFSVGTANTTVPDQTAATGTSDSGLGALRPQIDWPAAANADTYSIYLINLDTGAFVESATDITDTFYVPSTDLAEARHRILITARNGIGSSGQGPAFDFSVGSAATNPPPAPTGFAASDTDTDSPTVTWLESAGATEYQVYFINLDTQTLISDTRVATNSFEPTGLTDGNYRMWVRAINSLGSTRQDVPFDFTVAIPPSLTASAAIGGATPSEGEAESITDTDLSAIVDAAVGLYEAAGLDSESLAKIANVEVNIEDLPDWTLGVASLDTITLDIDAAGFGWFVDESPLDASEFASGVVDDSMDLLTAVMHELGHVLGLEDEPVETDALMSAWLSPGVRKDLDADLIDSILADD